MRSKFDDCFVSKVETRRAKYGSGRKVMTKIPAGTAYAIGFVPRRG